MKKFLSRLLMGDPVQKVEVDAPFDRVMEALEQAVRQNGFGIQAVHDLKQTYARQKMDLDPGFRYSIVEICEPAKSYKALTGLGYDMGVMMPKSIIVASENGKTTLRYMRLKPWMVSMMFPDWDVAPLSRNVSATLEKITRDTLAACEEEA